MMTLVELVGQFGVPIAVMIYGFWMLREDKRWYRKQFVNLVERTTGVIQNNTKVLIELKKEVKNINR